MDVNLTQLLDWSSSNYMKANVKKTKEMIISPSSCNVFNSLSVANVEIERVNVFKLLGVYINRSLLSGTIMLDPYVIKQPHAFIS